VHHANIPGAGIAYWAILLSVFVTALYSFRMYFLVFHGKPRMDDHTREHLRESPWVVTVPLLVLAIPSVIAGYWLDPIALGDFFNGVIYVSPEHSGLAQVAENFHGVFSFVLHGLTGPAVYLAAAGVWTAWYITLKNPAFADDMQQRFNGLYQLLVNKYYADDFNEVVFAGGARGVGQLLWKIGDVLIIDGLLVNGSAKVVGWTASVVRKIQTGHLYTYAFSMIIGLLLMLSWFVFLSPGVAQ